MPDQKHKPNLVISPVFERQGKFYASLNHRGPFMTICTEAIRKRLKEATGSARLPKKIHFEFERNDAKGRFYFRRYEGTFRPVFCGPRGRLNLLYIPHEWLWLRTIQFKRFDAYLTILED